MGESIPATIGARTKRTPDRRLVILRALRVGATKVLACKAAGVSETTFYDWVASDAEFSEAVQKAQGIAAVGWLRKIEQAASEGTWQAAAWKLERLYPEEYGRTVSDQRHSGSITLLTPAQLEELSDDELRAYRLRLSPGAS